MVLYALYDNDFFFFGGEGRGETYGVEMDKERHQLELDKKRIMQPSLA